MSSGQNIQARDHSSDPAPTPQNTPLDTAVLANRPANIGRPKVEDVAEGEDEDDDEDGAEDVGAMNPASLLAKNPALLALAQSKLGALVGAPSGYIQSLPAPVRRRLDGLKGVQVEHAKIESEFQMAILELEKKASGPPIPVLTSNANTLLRLQRHLTHLPCHHFLVKYEPLYERRAAIIAGKLEPTDEEVEKGQAADSDEEDEEDEEGAKITEVKEGEEDATVAGIPEFWLTALRNHAPISETITDSDEEALKTLQDIRLSYLDDKPGFRLHFTFGPNEFFEDSELTKTYYYQEEVGYGGDFVYDKAIGQDIKWKEEKDLTKKVEIKKQRNKTTGRTRVIRKVVPTDSFFNFFKPPQPPTPEQLENAEIEEEEIEELDARLELDYQLGEDFKEKIIPRAVDFFTGKALEYEDDMEEFDEEFDDEDDFEDDDEDAEAPAAAEGANPDCKQQ
ncbi:hypothetical protein EHS25_002821 [Saitozyma podzolica]|uniref:Nucleosome assembly protein n=1 Tax=Saitozyma podzolica TaxID=1890683 RepID=A0A427YCA4_9TREE|nr:hypothetical protein EHS25_002821 [Saitozyma podzolica]